MTDPAGSPRISPPPARLRAGTGLTGGREAALLGCVQDLARAARETSYVAMDRRQLEDYLQAVLSRLVRALVAEPFTIDTVYQVGTELVGAHFTGPEMSGRIVKILGSRLLPDLDLDRPAYRSRLAAVLGAISTSFARALRDRTLDDQEDIRRAAHLAQHSAERALRDSEERRRVEARRDLLTSLPNRVGFTEHLTGVLAGAAPGHRIGLALLNLDRFQAINDTLGPDAADQLLAAAADRFRDHLPAGAMLARIGGDEFALLVPATDGPDDLVKPADTLLAASPANPSTPAPLR
jgi:GGDEF domain-containing protein